MVARKPDGALHVILFDVHGVTEHDDVAAPDLAIRQHGLRCASGGRVDQLVHQNVIAHQQGVFHGCAGDHESLHQAGGGKQQQDDGDGPLGDDAAFHIVSEFAVARPEAAPGAGAPVVSFSLVSTAAIVSDETRSRSPGLVQSPTEGGLLVQSHSGITPHLRCASSEFLFRGQTGRPFRKRRTPQQSDLQNPAWRHAVSRRSSVTRIR